MSAYALQKLIREINRNPDTRARFLQSPHSILSGSELSEEESAALLAKDFGALYRLGVHGLLLRPFSILQGQSEPDYLLAIRGRGAP